MTNSALSFIRNVCSNCFSYPKRQQQQEQNHLASSESTDSIWELKQNQLLLHGAKQRYQLSSDQDLPSLENDNELLLKILYIGLNPIDWKSADYGFGLPSLPCINGREFVGEVSVSAKDPKWAHFKVGDKVLVISTDYRDFRKAAFQEYAVAPGFNVIRLPSDPNLGQYASVGVAFVTSIIALGMCFGLKWPTRDKSYLDFLSLARQQDQKEIPEDVLGTVFRGIKDHERPKPNEWILIMGASSISGQLAIQLAKLGGLKVAAVADEKKHGARLIHLKPDLIIDRHSLEKAEKQILAIDKPLRFVIDTVGRSTATWCQEILTRRDTTDFVDGKTASGDTPRLHLVGFTGLPRESSPQVQHHSLPIKLFHTNPEIGSAVSQLLEELLETSQLVLPETEIFGGGLDSVNTALDGMRNGDASGRRFVIQNLRHERK